MRQAAATETVVKKGKINKKYDTYLTPFEKFRMLANPEQFIKEGGDVGSIETDCT